ncbi:Similar to Chymotrypsin inhibitor (Apis mellifera) [Cotesia congregata]|uniref:Similar to Chymotrypsin inhibitor (Apis mellifera) n=1 Tax=Cotesia congregata TaxID=51543 RepID=A0A8J2EG62_COTCN|nr:Similar to Chymotrypsin inhibitor (Apis mellifera) [Cotesia congregata]
MRYLIVFLVLTIVAVNEGDGCGDNASYNECGSICAPSCDNLNPKNCPRIQCTKYTAGCRCDKGYVKNGDKCSLPQNCPPPCN